MAQKVIKKSNVSKDNIKKKNTGLLRKGGTQHSFTGHPTRTKAVFYNWK
jgi:predicted Ser/Thr protein kinase